jgi:hypothetical protein
LPARASSAGRQAGATEASLELFVYHGTAWKNAKAQREAFNSKLVSGKVDVLKECVRELAALGQHGEVQAPAQAVARSGALLGRPGAGDGVFDHHEY